MLLATTENEVFVNVERTAQNKPFSVVVFNIPLSHSKFSPSHVTPVVCLESGPTPSSRSLRKNVVNGTMKDSKIWLGFVQKN